MIQTPEDFCQWLQPDASIRSVQKSLYWLLSLRSARKKRQEYQIFWLAKHSGGYRPVAAPSPGLKRCSVAFFRCCLWGKSLPMRPLISRAARFCAMRPRMSGNPSWSSSTSLISLGAFLFQRSMRPSTVPCAGIQRSNHPPRHPLQGKEPPKVTTRP